MSKMTNLVMFCYLPGIETCLESKEQTSNFNKMFYLCIINFLWEKFEGVIFYLQSLKYLLENAENDQNWPFPFIFGHSHMLQTSLGNMEELLNF